MLICQKRTWNKLSQIQSIPPRLAALVSAVQQLICKAKTNFFSKLLKSKTIYLGSIRRSRFSVFFFSSNSCLVRSWTSDSKFREYLSKRLSKMFGFLKKLSVSTKSKKSRRKYHSQSRLHFSQANVDKAKVRPLFGLLFPAFFNLVRSFSL